MRSRGPGAIAAAATSVALLWLVHGDWVIPGVMAGLISYVASDGAEWLASRLGKPIRWGLAVLALGVIAVIAAFPDHLTHDSRFMTASYPTIAAMVFLFFRAAAWKAHPGAFR